MTSQIAVRIPTELLDDIDRFVQGGRFTSRAEVVRIALERMLDELRNASIDAAIEAGYRRVPDPETDPWVDAATRALVQDEPW